MHRRPRELVLAMQHISTASDCTPQRQRCTSVCSNDRGATPWTAAHAFAFVPRVEAPGQRGDNG